MENHILQIQHGEQLRPGARNRLSADLENLTVSEKCDFFFFFFFFFSPCCNLSSIQELLDAFQIAFGLNVLEIDGYLPILFIHVLGEVWKSGVT